METVTYRWVLHEVSKDRIKGLGTKKAAWSYDTEDAFREAVDYIKHVRPLSTLTATKYSTWTQEEVIEL